MKQCDGKEYHEQYEGEEVKLLSDKLTHNQKGMLSLDALFWLMLIAVTVGYFVYQGSKSLGNTDIALEQSNLATLIANTKKLKGSTGYGASSTNLVPTLVAVDGTASYSVTAGSGSAAATLKNSWNGAVTVVANVMTFTVQQTMLPKDACIALATKTARGKLVTTSINGGTAITGEVTAASATTGCSSDSNTIAWTSY